MKKGIILMILAGLFMFPAFAQHPPLDKNWKIVFEDNFNILNTSRWDIKDHVGNDTELQIYRTPNVYINNGKLVLETKKENYCCPPLYVTEWHCKRQWKTGQCYQYTSGNVWSKAPYKYGYFEIYAKLPGGNGFWPAFWLFEQRDNLEANTCWYNEIDIFEINDCKAQPFSMASIWDFTCPASNKHEDRTHIVFNYADAYHWYALEWDADKITWYIDSIAVKQVANDMEGKGIQNAMHIIINTALHAFDNECPITNNSVFPNYMYVDQANVWRLKCDKNTVVNEIPNFNTFCYAVKKSITLSGVTTIPAYSNISLRATDFIELKAGFELPLGAELYLDVNPCELDGANPCLK